MIDSKLLLAAPHTRLTSAWLRNEHRAATIHQ